MSTAHNRISLSSLVFGVAARPGWALACPDCPTAQAVRASVLDERFGSQLALVLLPLAILGAIAALTYRIGLPRAASRSRAQKGMKS
jgi:hypothetical protein